MAATRTPTPRRRAAARADADPAPVPPSPRPDLRPDEPEVLTRSGPEALTATLLAALHGDRAEPDVADAAEDEAADPSYAQPLTQGFHAYPASLDPRAAARLLSLGEGPVLDPFCGGGTVLVEALRLGRDALGLDVSPVACIVARARTTVTDEVARRALRVEARAAAEAAMNPDFALDAQVPEAVRGWYEPHVARELVALKLHIGNDPLLRAVFSAILVKVSQRESETRPNRVELRRPPGTTATLFHRKARELARRLESLAAAVPEGARARVHREDARDFRRRERFGMVVTSPPYPGVYDYLSMQALRAAWLDLPGDLHEELGSRRGFRADRGGALAAWEASTRRWLKSVARALAPGGKVVVVIGDGFGGGKLVPVLPSLLAAARELGLQRTGLVTVGRWDAGLRTVRPEHIVALETAG